MNERKLPIFIATPFIGQGDIHNEEWIDGRIALFEAVTKNSLLHLVEEEDVHWLIFLGRKLQEYRNMHNQRWANMKMFTSKTTFDAININAAEILRKNHS